MLYLFGTQLKRFTAAIVVTKEMTNLYTTQDLALAQVVSIASANNLIYELEAAMTFVLAPQTTDKTIISRIQIQDLPNSAQ